MNIRQCIKINFVVSEKIKENKKYTKKDIYEKTHFIY